MKISRQPRIILASTSPRREELFARLNLPFTIEPSEYEEDMTLAMSPQKLALTLSAGKAATVAKKHRQGLVIGADTFVVFNNQLLGKPKNKQQARAMLKKLTGHRVDILTGLTIIDSASHRQVSTTAITKVYLRKMSNSEINNYIASGEPLDKAGAFAIQGLGAVIVKEIQGDFTGAMGLPLFILAGQLKKFGVNIL